MRMTFFRPFDNSSPKRTASALAYLALTVIALSACAKITIQPKDPELIALGNFADLATMHLFEMNPATYEQYQGALEKDIAPNILAQLRAKGTCAKSKDQVKQIAKSMEKNNQRCLIKVEETTFPEKATAQGLIPIEVQGICVKTTSDTSKASKFDVLYLIGDNPKTKQPMVASVEIKKFD